MRENNNNVLLIFAIIVAIVSAAAFFVILNLNKAILLAPATGEEGTARVEIIQNARVNITYDLINFSSGYINPGTGALILDSNGTDTPYANWLNINNNPITLPDKGFVIENIGNVNLDLDVQLETAINTWLPPGPSTSPANLSYKVSNCDTTIPVVATDAYCGYIGSAPGDVPDTDPSCTFNIGSTARIYAPIAQPTQPINQTCNTFFFQDTRDEIRLDLRLDLPQDILPTAGPVNNRVILDIDAV